jgi:hypothetical protein
MNYHENHSNAELFNDVGVVIVNGFIEFTDVVQPIALGNTFVGGNVTATLTGWGWTTVSKNK